MQGHIEFPNKDIDDFIILRADGSPTYLLAVETPPCAFTSLVRHDGSLKEFFTERYSSQFKN